jgi:hypothetical protein
VGQGSDAGSRRTLPLRSPGLRGPWRSASVTPIRAFDPHGRRIAYRLVEPGAPERTRKWQESSEFQWTAWKTSRRAEVDIEVRAEGEPHENSSNEWDTFARFRYEVRPAQWRAEG